MHKEEWRLLPVMTQPAPVGVALDEVLLDCKHQGVSPNTVRLYHFNPPAVICGYHQAIEDEVNIDRVREYGFDLTRRITGGGTLFVAPDQIGIAVVVDREFVPRSPIKAIQWFSQAIINGLSRLGIDAVFRPKNDIAVNRRKLVGTGQAIRGHATLFHAIILLDLNVQTMLNVLKIPQLKFKGKELKNKTPLGWCFHSKFDIKERFTTINRELNGKVDLPIIYNALKKGFEDEFNCSLYTSGLVPLEHELHRKYVDRYKSDEWVFLRRLGDTRIKTYTEKTKGGLIRIKVALEKDFIKSILIVGDFFAFPSTAMFDLEARLKWSSAKPEIIRKNVNDFFKDNFVEIPWLSSDELADIIVKAVSS